jgi:hypothetical protein
MCFESRLSWLSLVLVPCGLLLFEDTSEAQQVDLAFGSGIATAPGNTNYESRYEPLLPNVEHTSLATQTLSIDPRPAPLFWGGVDWLPSPHSGFAARVEYRRLPVSGLNTPYDVSLTYTSRPPPSGEPTALTFEQSLDWPETDGELRQLTVSVGVIAHAGRPQGAGVRFFGGMGFTNVRGTLAPLGYTSFLLGGHSVLFEDHAQVTADLESTTKIGLSLGAELHAPLGGRAAFAAGIRYFLPQTMEVPVVPTGLVEGAPVPLREISAAELQRVLDPAPLTIRPTTFDVVAGLKIRLGS